MKWMKIAVMHLIEVDEDAEWIVRDGHMAQVKFEIIVWEYLERKLKGQ
jgi:hypothetical protein